MAAPRQGWRYIAQRLTGDGSSGAFLDLDVPLQDVEITDTLSGHNSLNATISPEIGRLIADDGAPFFDEWGTAIWAENGGEIRGGGIVTLSQLDGPVWNIECTGYTGYLKDLPYTDEWFGVEIDPLDVVRHIWENVQSKPGGNLGLELADTKVGYLIGQELEQIEYDTQAGPIAFEAGPVKLAWHLVHDLSKEVERLATDAPFDWHERHFWDGDVIRHKLDFGVPNIGRRREDLRFVVGENVQVLPSITRDGDDYASEVLVLGKGNGSAMTKGEASRRVNKLRRVAVVSDPTRRSKKAANALARQELAWRHDIDDVSDIVVRDTPHAPIGSVRVGDEIRLQGRTGWADIDMWARVISVTISPESGDAMRLSILKTDRIYR